MTTDDGQDPRRRHEPSTQAEVPAAARDTDHDRRRRRLVTRVALIGSVGIGGTLALLSGFLGGSGQLGLAVLLLVSALSCGLAALIGSVTAVVDDLRGRPVSRRRAVVAAALFVIAAMLMAMVAGIGG